MKRAIVPGIVVGVAVLAGAVSYRLSTDALALIVGVMLGLLVMVPVMAVLIWVARGQARAANDASYRYQAPAPPPVIVVQSPATPYASTPPPYSLPPAPIGVSEPLPPNRPARTWSLHVVGDADDVID